MTFTQERRRTAVVWPAFLLHPLPARKYRACSYDLETRTSPSSLWVVYLMVARTHEICRNLISPAILKRACGNGLYGFPPVETRVTGLPASHCLPQSLESRSEWRCRFAQVLAVYLKVNVSRSTKGQVQRTVRIQYHESSCFPPFLFFDLLQNGRNVNARSCRHRHKEGK